MNTIWTFNTVFAHQQSQLIWTFESFKGICMKSFSHLQILVHYDILFTWNIFGDTLFCKNLTSTKNLFISALYFFSVFLMCFLSMWNSWMYYLGHCTTSPKFSPAFFPYSPSFPIKMHATDAKTPKIEPDLNILWQTKVSEAVSVSMIDTTWARIYHLTCENFRLCVQWLLLLSSSEHRST